MTNTLDLAAAASAASIATVAVQALASWIKARGQLHRGDREVDAKLDHQRNELTFDLLAAARAEVAAFAKEVSELRPMSSRMAHLEEALDHISALLHAEGEAEVKAAKRRAQAYLRRMRPEIGDWRNTVQAAKSAKNVIEDIFNDKPESPQR